MKHFATAMAAIALAALLAAGAPARAEDCETVVTALTAVAIATKNFETTMDELKQIMSQGADDKKKATVKNLFCSASGEVLGASRATRAAAAACGEAQKSAPFDKSIKEMETVALH